MMATDERFDESISNWLEQTAPPRLPERVLEATFERTRRSRQQVGWRALLGGLHLTRSVFALGGAVVVVMAAALALNFYPNLPGLGGPPTASDPRSPFQGTWVSTTDADGGTQTMTVRVSADGAVEIVVNDDIASVCSGTPSTMTGTGRIEAGTRLVIPSPIYTCDDGSVPETLSGPPLQEQLRDWTLFLDPQTDTLTDGVGGVWLREGAELPSPDPALSGGMWPQTDLAEVQEAQRLADAGDPDYTWQLDAQLGVDYDPAAERFNRHEIEIADRFMREVLGWEAYIVNPVEGGDSNLVDGNLTDQRFLRCAPGRTNPLYPPQPDSEQPGESCAPTIDNLTYEVVSLDLAQVDRRGRDGIWVVSGWRLTTRFAQADPAVAEARATERLENFLAARIAHQIADGYVDVIRPPGVDVPLLYETTSGDPYERYEIERASGPEWPYGSGTFSTRLFTNGDATVVEQEIGSDWEGGLWMNATSTTENGQPIELSYTSPDGEVTVSASSTWTAWVPGSTVGGLYSDVWFGMLWPTSDPYSDFSHVTIGLVDPVAYDSWCEENGGSPLLSAPASAAEIAQQVIADPNFETTEPVTARIGGLDALSMDVALAPGGEACGTLGIGIEISRWVHELGSNQGLRQRLYLVDLPEGMSIDTLAITVKAPEDRFQEFIAETAPIIESIEFHVP